MPGPVLGAAAPGQADGELAPLEEDLANTGGTGASDSGSSSFDDSSAESEEDADVSDGTLSDDKQEPIASGSEHKSSRRTGKQRFAAAKTARHRKEAGKGKLELVDLMLHPHKSEPETRNPYECVQHVTGKLGFSASQFPGLK